MEANGRLQRWNNKARTTEGYGGKRQAATLEQQMLVASVLGGSCREGF